MAWRRVSREKVLGDGGYVKGGKVPSIRLVIGSRLMSVGHLYLVRGWIYGRAEALGHSMQQGVEVQLRDQAVGNN